MTATAKPRPQREVLMALVQPAGDLLVARLARTRVEPWHIVTVHTALGLVTAACVGTAAPRAWILAAALLQVKTILDNADGGLARATDRVTEFGRYFDTVCDLGVNLAIFVALAQHGSAFGSVVGFMVLTFALSADFNAEKRYRDEHRWAAESSRVLGGGAADTPTATEPLPARPEGHATAALRLRVVRGIYRVVLEPQDRACRSLDAMLFHVAAGMPWSAATTAQRRRWADIFSTGALVNLGLSTQYLVLGVFLMLGLPYAYVVFCWWLLPYLMVVQAVRLWRYRVPYGTT